MFNVNQTPAMVKKYMMCFLLSLLFLTAFTQSPKNIMGPKDSSSTSDDLPSDFHQRWQYDDGLSYFMQTGNNQWTEINWKGKITFHYVLIEEKPSFTLLYDISRNLYVKLTNSQLFFGNGRYSADSPSKRGAWVDKIQSIEGIEPNGIKRLSASDYNKKPIAAGDSVTDIDGNVYHVVKIGKQYWLQENLKTSHFSDSSVIPEMEYNTDWPYAGGPARCYYERNPQNNDPYGKLYNWYAAADPRNAGRRDLGCPFGCREAHRRRQASRRSTAYYQDAEGKRKRRQQNARRRKPLPTPRPALSPEASFPWPRPIVEYVRMVATLIEGYQVSLAEVVEMLRRVLRQHSIVRTRRIDQIIAQLHEHPP